MSLATLHTDAGKLLAATRGYPARIAMRAAERIVVDVFKTEPEVAKAMQRWHAGGADRDSSEPQGFIDAGHAPAFALIDVATRKPLLLIGALGAFAALPILLLSKFI